MRGLRQMEDNYLRAKRKVLKIMWAAGLDEKFGSARLARGQKRSPSVLKFREGVTGQSEHPKFDRILEDKLRRPWEA